MASARRSHDWLRQYGNTAEYQWHRATLGSRSVFRRPLGLVESAFDADGRYYEGRADLNGLLEVEIKSTLDLGAFRDRIVLAWTRSRHQQLLLQARCVHDETLGGQDAIAPSGLHFVVDVVDRVEDAVANAVEHCVFLDGHAGSESRDFSIHSQNVGRVIDPGRALAKLFVFTPQDVAHGRATLRFLFVMAHQISDGLSSESRNRRRSGRIGLADPMPDFVMVRDFISYLSTLR